MRDEGDGTVRGGVAADRTCRTARHRTGGNVHRIQPHMPQSKPRPQRPERRRLASASTTMSARHDGPGEATERQPLLGPTAARAQPRRVPESVFVVVLLVLLVSALVHTIQRDDERMMHRVCTTRHCLVASFELMSYLNESADPCDDFYEYATGGWRTLHPIAAGATPHGVREQVEAQNDRTVRELLATMPDDDLSPADRQSLHKLRTFYEACTNTHAQNEAGAAPLLELLHELSRQLQAPNATTAAVAWLHARGFPVLFDTLIDGDPGRAPLTATPRIHPSGLGLPGPAAYDDAPTRHWYEELVRQGLAGLRGDARAVVAFEQQLAQLHPSPAELADPTATYHPLLTADLQVLAPFIDWPSYLHAQSPRVLPHRVLVTSPAYMRQLAALLHGTPTHTLHAYLHWAVVRDAGHWLGPDVPLGRPARELQPQPSCIAALHAALGHMSGRFFAEHTQPHVRDVQHMIDSIRTAYAQRLPDLPWLDPAAHAEARAKLRALQAQIGAPTQPNAMDADAIDAWYADLLVGDAHWANALAARMHRRRQAWSHIGGELPPGSLGDLLTTEATTAYSAPRNTILCPAGVLQLPYYDHHAPMYLQYGALGSLLAHEMTQAIDTPGRFYDPAGRLRPGRRPAPRHARTEACIDGLARSYDAWLSLLSEGDSLTYARNMRLPGLLTYTHEQLFFLAYGAMWAHHAPSRQRVNDALAHFAPFAAAFQCPPRRKDAAPLA